MPKTTTGATTSVAASTIALVWPTPKPSRSHTVRLRALALKDPLGIPRPRTVKSGARGFPLPSEGRPRTMPAFARNTSSGTAATQRATSTVHQCLLLAANCQLLSATVPSTPAGTPTFIGVYQSASCLAIQSLAISTQSDKVWVGEGGEKHLRKPGTIKEIKRA